MRCWNCEQEVPDDAAVCLRCETDLTDPPTDDEIAMATEAIKMLTEEERGELLDAISKSATADDFVNQIMIGDCPKCGSSKVGNCENDVTINDITVGRCYDCGLLWCTMCDRVFEKGEIRCACSDLDDLEN